MPPYLDSANQAFVDAGARAGGPPLQNLSYKDARQVLEGLQKHTTSGDVGQEEVDVPTSSGSTKCFLYKPASAKGDLPVIFYFHGGGWILGSPSTHYSLV